MKNLLRCISKVNKHLLKEPNINDALDFYISSIGTEKDSYMSYIFINQIITKDFKL
jgi:hypothetical protein